LTPHSFLIYSLLLPSHSSHGSPPLTISPHRRLCASPADGRSSFRSREAQRVRRVPPRARVHAGVGGEKPQEDDAIQPQ
ncbi:hypothetical protein PFISCL1PPCAC_23670, partial [Pristionchus fissidentatus]